MRHRAALAITLALGSCALAVPSVQIVDQGHAKFAPTAIHRAEHRAAERGRPLRHSPTFFTWVHDTVWVRLIWNF